MIVKSAEYVVTRSGRVPISFILYVPGSFLSETNIVPVIGLTLRKSFDTFKGRPSELLTPVYVQFVAKEPQFKVAEKGVIASYYDILLYKVKVLFA
jgi:hypothetical protein